MFKPKRAAASILLAICVLLSVCSAKAAETESMTADTTPESTPPGQPDTFSSAIEMTDSECIDFRCLYRGFTAIQLNDTAAFEAFSEIGTRILLSEEDWNAYMGKFCPGIPYYESCDFSKECLLASVVMGARPSYAQSRDLISLKVENGCFVPEYEDDPAACIYALNSNDTTHFYVEVLILNRQDLPSNIEDLVYYP